MEKSFCLKKKPFEKNFRSEKNVCSEKIFRSEKEIFENFEKKNMSFGIRHEITNDSNPFYRVIVKLEPSETRSTERSPNLIAESNDIVMNTIKIENVEISDNEEDGKNSDDIDADSARAYQRSSNVTRTLLTSVTAPNSISLNASTSGDDDKYCHTCDIKFKYMSSYLAHKKSYCRNVENDMDIGPVTPNPPRSSPNQTSVVT